MPKEFKILGVIPARYKSSRFPGKPLVKIKGIPLVIRVCKKVEIALGKNNFVVATDDNRIKKLVESYGYNVVMTSPNHPTGTDRVFEVSQKIKADFYINIQGDEPMINPDDINLFVEKKIKNPDKVINGYAPLGLNEDAFSVNIPKVILKADQGLLYMSRLPIPGSKSPGNTIYFKQICIYVFTAAELKLFNHYSEKFPNEKSEDIEILRFLELGYPVQMVKVFKASLAVDVPDDIKKVEDAL